MEESWFASISVTGDWWRAEVETALRAGVSPARGRQRMGEGELDRRKSEVGVGYVSAL